jgi:K+-transporting ATPase KdpF subunit
VAVWKTYEVALMILSAPRHRYNNQAQREGPMVFDYSLAALVSFGLLIYLLYALLRPERF